MAKIGVSKPKFAKYSESNGVVTYSGGGSLGKMVNVDVSIDSSDDNNFYADNGIAETDRQFSGGTFTANTDDLSHEVSKAILGLKEQELGEITGVTDTEVKELIYDDDQVMPYLGLGFIIKKKVKGVTKWRAVILTKAMFSVPNDAATTQGETIDWQTEELSATIMRDDTEKHAWKKEATFTTEAQAEASLNSRLNITEVS